MSTIDLDALERIAQAATPGPWEAGDVWVFTDPIYPDDRRLSNVLGMKYADEERAHAEHARGLRNAEHIAAFDPSTVLALIARVRELEAIVNDGGNQAAKYWTRLTAAEREMHARELHHFEEEKLREEAEAARDRYRAAIEKALALLGAIENEGEN